MPNKLIFLVIFLLAPGLFAQRKNTEKTCKSMLQQVDRLLLHAQVSRLGNIETHRSIGILNEAIKQCKKAMPFYKAAVFVWKFRYLPGPFDPDEYPIIIDGKRVVDPLVIIKKGLEKENSLWLQALKLQILIEKGDLKGLLDSIGSAASLLHANVYFKYVYAKAMIFCKQGGKALPVLMQVVDSDPCFLDAVMAAQRLITSTNKRLNLLHNFAKCEDSSKKWVEPTFSRLLLMQPMVGLVHGGHWPPTIWQTGPPKDLFDHYYSDLVCLESKTGKYRDALLHAIEFLSSTSTGKHRISLRQRAMIKLVKRSITTKKRHQIFNRIQSKVKSVWIKYLR